MGKEVQSKVVSVDVGGPAGGSVEMAMAAEGERRERSCAASSSVSHLEAK